jgi:Phage P22-like portal protein
LSEKQEDKDKKQLNKMKKWLKVDKKADNHNRSLAVETLKFINGEQWDEAIKQKRKLRGRPVMQINVLPKYAKQIRGEWLKNCVRIKVRPVDSKADLKIAKVREGIISNIEYLSNAEDIYNENIDVLSNCGYASWRIRARQTEEDAFLQELYIENIQNPLSVYFDCDSRQPNYSDARRVWIIEVLSRKEFEEKYPDASIPGNSVSENNTGQSEEAWYHEDQITVAECYYKEITEKKMAMLSDDRRMTEAEANEYIGKIKETYEKVKNDQETKRAEALSKGVPFAEQPVDDSGIPTIVKKATIKETKIKWVLMTAEEFIEQKDWPGSILPVVMVNGEIRNIEGKKYIFGLYKDAMDPQRMLNHWHTSASEFVAMAPKAQWQATANMIEGYESRYAAANEDNDPVMLSNIDEEAAKVGWLFPKRTEPPTIPTAIFQEISRAEKNIKDCIGMYNVDVGDQGREISGKAIEARQVPGDTATYIYPKKMSKGIMWTGRILNDCLNYYYDTERDARLRNIDETETVAPINTPVSKVMSGINENPGKFQGIKKQDLIKASKNGGVFNNITVGKYDVIISTAPTYASQRAEAAENMIKMASATKVSPLDKYLIYKNSDFPGADEAAEIYKKMVPPSLIPPKPGEPPMPPQPPTPQVQLMKAKTDAQMAEIEVKKMRLKVEFVKLQKEMAENGDTMDAKIIARMEALFSVDHPADQLLPPEA